MAKVYVLRSGDLHYPDNELVRAPATVGLIKSAKDNILVDFGALHDTPEDFEGWLGKHDLSLKDITKGVLTHAHVDHIAWIGYVYKMSKAHIFVPDSFVVPGRDHTYSAPVLLPCEIAKGVQLIGLPGHSTSLDLGILVDTQEGKVVFAGDMFLDEKEFRNPDKFDAWPPADEALARSSRQKIIELRPYLIIPGHGPAFLV